MSILNIAKDSASLLFDPALRFVISRSKESSAIFLGGEQRSSFPLFQVINKVKGGNVRALCGWDVRSQCVAVVAALYLHLVARRQVSVIWRVHETPVDIQSGSRFGFLGLRCLRHLSRFVDHAVFPSSIHHDLFAHEGVVCRNYHIVPDGYEAFDQFTVPIDGADVSENEVGIVLRGCSDDELQKVAQSLRAAKACLPNLRVEILDGYIYNDDYRTSLQGTLFFGIASEGAVPERRLCPKIVYVAGRDEVSRNIGIRLLGSSVILMVQDSPMARSCFGSYAQYVDEGDDSSIAEIIKKVLSYSDAELRALRGAAAGYVRSRHSVANMESEFQKLFSMVCD